LVVFDVTSLGVVLGRRCVGLRLDDARSGLVLDAGFFGAGICLGAGLGFDGASRFRTCFRFGAGICCDGASGFRTCFRFGAGLRFDAGFRFRSRFRLRSDFAFDGARGCFRFRWTVGLRSRRLELGLSLVLRDAGVGVDLGSCRFALAADVLCLGFRDASRGFGFGVDDLCIAFDCACGGFRLRGRDIVCLSPLLMRVLESDFAAVVSDFAACALLSSLVETVSDLIEVVFDSPLATRVLESVFEAVVSDLVAVVCASPLVARVVASGFAASALTGESAFVVSDFLTDVSGLVLVEDASGLVEGVVSDFLVGDVWVDSVLVV
jgi:hypothetical protein